MHKQFTFLLATFFAVHFVQAQQDTNTFIRSIYSEALSKGKSYEDLHSLCKDIGPRLSGSAQAQMAIEWGKSKLESYGFDKVYLQEIKVPHWVRGTKEAGWLRTETGQFYKLDLLALGGSVGTNGILHGEIIAFKSIAELTATKPEQIKGKVVFLNQRMNPTDISTFESYRGCVSIRSNGAAEAAKKGAIGLIIRSVGIPEDKHPHTGSVKYDDSINYIPAAAISTENANLLENLLAAKKVFIDLEMDCKTLPDITSYNVIGELSGSSKVNEIITVGGHLDSWDVGEGAHDDGAGIIHAMEALRILKQLHYHPKHTIRVVFFMNEENGNRGGMAYSDIGFKNGEQHIAALESDRGGFTPRGFDCNGSDAQLNWFKDLSIYFKPYDLHYFEKGYGGVDIGPLKSNFPSILLFGFIPDSQRYFDFHHAETDVFESVNKRELELGCASIATFLYLLDSRL